MVRIGSIMSALFRSRVESMVLKIGPTKLKIVMCEIGPVVSVKDYSEHVVVETKFTQVSRVSVGSGPVVLVGVMWLFTVRFRISSAVFLTINR